MLCRLFVTCALLGHVVLSLPAARAPRYTPLPDEVDSDETRRVLGSSVVTSVSVIMDLGNGSQALFSESPSSHHEEHKDKPIPSIDNPMSPEKRPVGSPPSLLSPDRYEFYTFDESGELVRRLMTLEQIQSLIAGGDDANRIAAIPIPVEIDTVPSPLATDPQGQVVANVQQVLAHELLASTKKNGTEPQAVEVDSVVQEMLPTSSSEPEKEDSAIPTKISTEEEQKLSPTTQMPSQFSPTEMPATSEMVKQEEKPMEETVSSELKPQEEIFSEEQTTMRPAEVEMSTSNVESEEKIPDETTVINVVKEVHSSIDVATEVSSIVNEAETPLEITTVNEKESQEHQTSSPMTSDSEIVDAMKESISTEATVQEVMEATDASEADIKPEMTIQESEKTPEVDMDKVKDEGAATVLPTLASIETEKPEAANEEANQMLSEGEKAPVETESADKKPEDEIILIPLIGEKPAEDSDMQTPVESSPDVNPSGLANNMDQETTPTNQVYTPSTAMESDIKDIVEEVVPTGFVEDIPSPIPADSQILEEADLSGITNELSKPMETTVEDGPMEVEKDPVVLEEESATSDTPVLIETNPEIATMIPSSVAQEISTSSPSEGTGSGGDKEESEESEEDDESLLEQLAASVEGVLSQVTGLVNEDYDDEFRKKPLTTVAPTDSTEKVQELAVTELPQPGDSGIEGNKQEGEASYTESIIPDVRDPTKDHSVPTVGTEKPIDLDDEIEVTNKPIISDEKGSMTEETIKEEESMQEESFAEETTTIVGERIQDNVQTMTTAQYNQEEPITTEKDKMPQSEGSTEMPMKADENDALSMGTKIENESTTISMANQQELDTPVTEIMSEDEKKSESLPVTDNASITEGISTDEPNPAEVVKGTVDAETVPPTDQPSEITTMKPQTEDVMKVEGEKVDGMKVGEMEDESKEENSKEEEEEVSKEEDSREEESKEEESKENESKEEIKEDGIKEDEIKNDEKKEDMIKEDEKKEDMMKEDEKKEDEMKEDEKKEDMMKEDEKKEDEMEEDEMKDDEKKENEMREDEKEEDEMKGDENKEDEMKEDEKKEDEMEEDDKKETQEVEDNEQKNVHSNEQDIEVTTTDNIAYTTQKIEAAEEVQTTEKPIEVYHKLNTANDQLEDEGVEAVKGVQSDLLLIENLHKEAALNREPLLPGNDPPEEFTQTPIKSEEPTTTAHVMETSFQENVYQDEVPQVSTSSPVKESQPSDNYKPSDIPEGVEEEALETESPTTVADIEEDPVKPTIESDLEHAIDVSDKDDSQNPWTKIPIPLVHHTSTTPESDKHFSTPSTTDTDDLLFSSPAPDDLPDPNGLLPLLTEKPAPSSTAATPDIVTTEKPLNAGGSSTGQQESTTGGTVVPPLMSAFPPAPNGNSGLESTSASTDPDVKLFVDLCNDLAFALYGQVTSGAAASSVPATRGANGGGVQTRSLVVSPFAITSLLAMVFLGARGRTAEEMNDLLRLDDMVTFNPHQVLFNVTESVISSPGVSAAAFVRELYSDKANGKLLDFYKARANAFYNGHVEEVDFKEVNDVLRRRTNHLVRWQTRGRVPEYLRGSSLKLRSPLAALSANFFEADCQRASSTGTDGEMYFEVPATGRRRRRLVPVPAVVWRGIFLAGHDPGLDATVLELRHGGGEVSTVLVLPGRHGQSIEAGDISGGLTRLETWLVKGGRESWSTLLRSALPRGPMEVQLPRFAHRSVLNATGALSRMGLEHLFQDGKADLGGLNGGLGGKLHLADIIQMTAFGVCADDGSSKRHLETYPSAQRTGRKHRRSLPDASSEERPDRPRGARTAWVDELAREEENSYVFAAAAAARELPLAVRPRQARIPRPALKQQSSVVLPRLRFDRPFLYFVRHNPSGFILLMGRFNPRLFP